MELNNSEPREVGQNPSYCSSLRNVSAYLESFSPGVLHRGKRKCGITERFQGKVFHYF